MILTQCPACAAPLPDTSAKQCSRCKTGYCGAACQKKHWEEGGHDRLCRRIKRGGGAEQYHADKKYKEAVAVAVKKCAEDTKGQTCYICLEAVHPRTGEGLVRGCACGDRDGVASGRTGIAHVSCLVEQAKILCDEAEENNLGDEMFYERFNRWDTCSLCKQGYHGVVHCALGWGCWKTYVRRPEGHALRCVSIGNLGNGLSGADQHEDALTVRETHVSMLKRFDDSESNLLAVQGNLANTYANVGRMEEALSMRREVYSGDLRINGEEHPKTLREASNYANTLIQLERFEEAKSVLRKMIPVARRVAGDNDEVTFKMRCIYAQALYKDSGSTLDDLRESVATLEDVVPRAQRVQGGAHPQVVIIEEALRNSRTALDARRAQSPEIVAGEFLVRLKLG